MPLIKSKSKKAFEKNIKAEVNAGKPVKQAVAIAYDMKRRARHMAEGGEVEDSESEFAKQQRLMSEEQQEKELKNQKVDEEEDDISAQAKRHRFAHGGMVEMDRPKSIAEAIMRKRKMAEGGMVDDDQDLDDRNKMADIDIGEDEDMSLFPELSGSSELGDSEEDEAENKLDMISSIRRKLKLKRGF